MLEIRSTSPIKKSIESELTERKAEKAVNMKENAKEESGGDDSCCDCCEEKQCEEFSQRSKSSIIQPSVIVFHAAQAEEAQSDDDGDDEKVEDDECHDGCCGEESVNKPDAEKSRKNSASTDAKISKETNQCTDKKSKYGATDAGCCSSQSKLKEVVVCGEGVKTAQVRKVKCECCEVKPCTAEAKNGCCTTKVATNAVNADASLNVSKANDIVSVSARVRESALQWAVFLAVLTVIGNAGEAVVSLFFGASNDDSISLLGFGADSAVEIISAIFIFFNCLHQLQEIKQPNKVNAHAMSAAKNPSWSVERLSAIGISFLLICLAITILITSIVALVFHHESNASIPAVIIALCSISYMLAFFVSKSLINLILKSPALSGDIACAKSCILLSLVLLIGNAIDAAVPSAWFVDDITAILISAVIFKDGYDGLKGALSKEFSGSVCGCTHDEEDSGMVNDLMKKIFLRFMPQHWKSAWQAPKQQNEQVKEHGKCSGEGDDCCD